MFILFSSHILSASVTSTVINGKCETSFLHLLPTILSPLCLTILNIVNECAFLRCGSLNTSPGCGFPRALEVTRLRLCSLQRASNFSNFYSLRKELGMTNQENDIIMRNIIYRISDYAYISFKRTVGQAGRSRLREGLTARDFAGLSDLPAGLPERRRCPADARLALTEAPRFRSPAFCRAGGLAFLFSSFGRVTSQAGKGQFLVYFHWKVKTSKRVVIRGDLSIFHARETTGLL